VDSIGGLDVAIKSAAGLAKIIGDYDIKEYPRSKSTTELLTEMFERNPQPVAALGDAMFSGRGPAQRLARDVMRQMSVLLTYDDPRGVYARMPYVLVIL